MDVPDNSRAFVIMQVGGKESPERKRADEIYNFVVAPSVRAAGLEPYRADLDLTPGGITPKMLAELLEARVVIADLTGRNPNVFYELGIAHSFARPLISIADDVTTLPFDAKDERVIELGTYAESGLTYAQGESAKAFLQESLKIVLSPTYVPPSPLREVAANRSVDQLAPDNPLAAEMAQMRETLEDIRRRVARTSIPRTVTRDILALREVVERNLDCMDESDFAILRALETSNAQDEWVDKLLAEQAAARIRRPGDPSASDSGEGPPF